LKIGLSRITRLQKERTKSKSKSGEKNKKNLKSFLKLKINFYFAIVEMYACMQQC
jgi:hypothetical protein